MKIIEVQNDKDGVAAKSNFPLDFTFSYSTDFCLGVIDHNGNSYDVEKQISLLGKVRLSPTAIENKLDLLCDQISKFSINDVLSFEHVRDFKSFNHLKEHVEDLAPLYPEMKEVCQNLVTALSQKAVPNQTGALLQLLERTESCLESIMRSLSSVEAESNEEKKNNIKIQISCFQDLEALLTTVKDTYVSPEIKQPGSAPPSREVMDTVESKDQEKTEAAKATSTTSPDEEKKGTESLPVEQEVSVSKDRDMRGVQEPIFAAKLDLKDSSDLQKRLEGINAIKSEIEEVQKERDCMSLTKKLSLIPLLRNSAKIASLQSELEEMERYGSAEKIKHTMSVNELHNKSEVSKHYEGVIYKQSQKAPPIVEKYSKRFGIEEDAPNYYQFRHQYLNLVDIYRKSEGNEKSFFQKKAIVVNKFEEGGKKYHTISRPAQASTPNSDMKIVFTKSDKNEQKSTVTFNGKSVEVWNDDLFTAIDKFFQSGTFSVTEDTDMIVQTGLEVEKI